MNTETMRRDFFWSPGYIPSGDIIKFNQQRTIARIDIASSLNNMSPHAHFAGRAGDRRSASHDPRRRDKDKKQ
jgi:hypothetical protein